MGRLGAGAREAPTGQGTGLPPLAGRLAPPPLPVPFVPRPRLWELLDGAASRALTVVRGPAGTGKTALLASWYLARRESLPLVWLQVDPACSAARAAPGPSRASLWEHLLLALRAHPEAAAAGALDGLCAPAPGANPDRFCRDLANALTRGRPRPLVLVLDDIGLLSDLADLAGLAQLAAAGSGAPRLVLAGRRIPLPTHQARAAGQLTEIGPERLAFDPAETTELVTALGLPAALAPGLRALAEGWAAGSRLVAGGLSELPDPAAALTRTTAGARDALGDAAVELPAVVVAPVAEYLRVEGVAAAPSPLRTALLRTAVLQAVCAPLAEAVVAEPGGGQLLLAEFAAGDVLASAAVVGTASEGGVPWFRYHTLLRATLRDALRRDPAEDEAELHLRAALWHAANRRLADAARHARFAGDWRYLASLAVRGPVPLLLQGGLPDLAVQLAGFPDAAARLGPECALAAAVDRVLAGDVPVAGEHLEKARAGITAGAQPNGEMGKDGGMGAIRRAVAGAVEAVELRRAELSGDVDATLTAVRRALRPRPAPLSGPAAGLPDGLRPLALCARGRAELWRGRLEIAEDALRVALAEARRIGLDGAVVSCLGALALDYALRGRLRQADETAAAALAAVAQARGVARPRLPGAARARPAVPGAAARGAAGEDGFVLGNATPVAVALVEQALGLPPGDLAAPGAGTRAEAGLGEWLAGPTPAVGVPEALLALATVAGHRGDVAGGLGWLSLAASAAGSSPGSQLSDLVNVLRAWLRLGRRDAEDLRAARRALAAPHARETPALLTALRESTQADLLVAAGNADAALRLLGDQDAPGARDRPAARLARGRAQLAQGDAAGAALAVAPLLRADRGGSVTVVGACAISAVAAARRGDGAQAAGLLARAFALAQDELLLRPFLELGPEIMALTDAHPGLPDAAPGLVGALRQALAGRSGTGETPLPAAPPPTGRSGVTVPSARRAPLPAPGRVAPVPPPPGASSQQRRAPGAEFPPPLTASARPADGGRGPARPGGPPGRITPFPARPGATRPGLGDRQAPGPRPRHPGAGYPPGPAVMPGAAGAPDRAAQAARQPDRAAGALVDAAFADPAAPLGTDARAPAPGGGPYQPAMAERGGRGADRLSDREMAVLSYLPTMLTTAEIAAELYVSVNTVKTHLKSIYRKLDVARRRDAVHRARALHLL